jgi:putative oxidoreductase
MAILGKQSEPVYALFRIVVGFLFMCHGLDKMFGIFTEYPQPPLASLGGAAGVIELVCGFLVMIGLFTSWAAFLASGTMAVAYFIGHQAKGALPIQNEGLPAVLFCFAFLLIATRGSGIWSVARAARKPAWD